CFNSPFQVFALKKFKSLRSQTDLSSISKIAYSMQTIQDFIKNEAVIKLDPETAKKIKGGEKGGNGNGNGGGGGCPPPFPS
ncbi:MAG: hypothetical protein AAB316_11520, partial [Bacteroidota bacterium]